MTPQQQDIVALVAIIGGLISFVLIWFGQRRAQQSQRVQRVMRVVTPAVALAFVAVVALPFLVPSSPAPSEGANGGGGCQQRVAASSVCRVSAVYVSASQEPQLTALVYILATIILALIALVLLGVLVLILIQIGRALSSPREARTTTDRRPGRGIAFIRDVMVSSMGNVVSSTALALLGSTVIRLIGH